MSDWKNEKAEFTACFSGHRPEKIFSETLGGVSEISVPEDMLKSVLEYEILSLIRQGYMRFISGFARGIDLWAAEIILRLMHSYPVELIGAMPMNYNDHTRNFNQSELALLNLALKKTVHTFYAAQTPFKGCHHARNRFMVDNSNMLLAAVLDYNSGTGQTISYARKRKININIIDINFVVKNGGQQTIDNNSLRVLPKRKQEENFL